MVEIIWLKPAKIRMQEIYRYYKNVAGINTALKIRDRIYNRISTLADHPRIGAQERYLEDANIEFRYLVVGNYKIIYWVDSGKAIIATIFDTRQDPEKLHKEISNSKKT